MTRMSRSGSWLASAAADALQPGARFDTRSLAAIGRPYLFVSVLSGQSVVKFSSVLSEKVAWISRLLISAKLLKSRITPERIEHRIESEQCRSERRAFVEGTVVRY